MARLLGGGHTLLSQILYVGIVPVLMGVRWLWQTGRWLCLYLVALVLSSFALTIYYPVLDNDVYLLSAVYSLCLFLGIGTARLDAMLRGRVARYALVGCLTLLCGGSVLQHFPELNRRGDFTATSFAQEALNPLPERAVVLSDQDETTFALWYEQALGMRKDILVIDTRLLFYAWYRQHLLAEYPDIDGRYLRPGGITGLPNAVYQVRGMLPDFVLMQLK